MGLNRESTLRVRWTRMPGQRSRLDAVGKLGSWDLESTGARVDSDWVTNDDPAHVKPTPQAPADVPD